MKKNKYHLIILIILVVLLIAGGIYFENNKRAYAAGVDRYWVGGSGNWTPTDTTHWSDVSGGTGGKSVPTAADNVYFDANSASGSYTVTSNGGYTVVCNNLSVDKPTGAGTTITFTGYNGLNVSGNINYIGGSAGIIGGQFSTLSMVGSGTQTITSNGLVHNVFAFKGSGTVKLIDQFIAKGNLTFSQSFDANGQTVLLINNSDNFSQTLTMTVPTTLYNLTFDPTQPGGVNNAGDGLILAGDLTIAHNFTNVTVDNNKRLLISSDTYGVQRTITCNGTMAPTYADFRDIKGAGSASWDLSAITGLSGDAGGNSGITFTTPTNQHWTKTNGGWMDWNTPGYWTSRVPLPQDNVFMDCAFAANQTVAMGMIRPAKNIDWTGATWTGTLTWSMGSSWQMYGSLTLIDNLLLAFGGSSFIFAGRTNSTFTQHSVTFSSNITVDMASSSLVTLTLGGNLTLPATKTLTINYGGFSAVNGGNNYVISTGLLSMGAGGTLTLGSATHLLTGVGTVFTGAGTINANASTLKITDTSASAVTFAGGTETYNNVWFSRGASTASTTISGNNIFNDFKDDGTAAHNINFTHGTTQHVTTFTVNGTAGNLITINSEKGSTATHALVKDGGGTISSDYLNIQHSVATPTGTWYAGTHSTNNQAVTTAGSGWIFSAVSNRIWSGAADTNLNNPLNYSGSGPLLSTDNLLFNSGSVNASSTANLDVNSLVVTSGYTGNMTFAGHTATLEGNDASFDGTGTLNLGNGITLNGASATLHIGAGVGAVTSANCAIVMNGTTAMTLDIQVGSLTFSSYAQGNNAIVNSTSVGLRFSTSATPFTLGNNSQLTTNNAFYFYRSTSGPLVSVGTSYTLTANATIRFFPNASNITVTMPALTIGGSGDVKYFCDAGALTGMTIQFTGSQNYGTKELDLNVIHAGEQITYDFNGQSVTCGTFYPGPTTSLTTGYCIIKYTNSNITVSKYDGSTLTNYATTENFGNSQWNVSGSGSAWTMGSNHTIVASTSLIKFTNTSNTAITFAGAGKTYYNIWFSRGASTAANTITGANTFNDFKDDGTAAHSLLFTKSTTNNITTWHVSGAGGGIRTILDTADSAGTFTLHGNGTTLSADWLDIRRSTVDASPVWYAGANSLNTISNTNWIFTAPPSGTADYEITIFE